MKKIIYSLMVIFSITIFQLKAQQNSLDSGLAAYYPFTGNDLDASTMGNHPIYNNATLTTDRFGMQNSAYHFNGQNSYIQIPNSGSLNFNNTISLCAWVKVTDFYKGLCLGNNILQKGDNDNVSGMYVMRFSDLINGCNGSTPNSTQEVFYGSVAATASPAQYIQKAKWYFLVSTYDGNYGKFYIDGKLVSTMYSPNYRFSNTHDLFFGRLNNWQYPYWLNGDLDDIRIYNRVLTRNEVRKLYTETTSATLVGNVYVDNDANGVKGGLDYGSSYTKIKLSNGDVAFTDYNGDYAMNVDSTGSYIVSIDSSNTYTPTPVSDSVNIATVDTTITKDFRMLLNSTALDSVQVSIIPLMNAARPGFSYPCVINYVNTGNTILNVVNNFVYDSTILQYDSSSNISVIQNWNVLSVTSNFMYPSQRNVFIAYFTVKPTAHLGDSIKLYTIAAGGSANYKDSIWARIRGSYDPNEKDATPILSTTEVTQGKYINYIVRFENTGTDTAFKVVVTDELSNLLDLNSVQIIAASHTLGTQINDNKISFTFNKINLPYTAMNNIKSHGYIKFRVKPIATVAAGTIINNKAAIYFDYNLPIITNTATTLIKAEVLPVKISSYEVTPTPSKEGLNNWSVKNVWTTVAEINTSYFNVQRSIDGKNFETIETVAAKGIGNYEFIDNRLPLNGNTFYYRLQIIDKDGSKAYSQIKSIVLNKKQETRNVVLFPNPATNLITISRKNVNSIAESLTITDITGKIIKTIVLNTTVQTVNISSLTNGVYILNFESGEKIKLIKQ